MACPCCQCPCGQDRNASGQCVSCVLRLFLSATWAGLALPDAFGRQVWSISDESGNVYTLALRSTAGVQLPTGGGFQTIDGVCYFVQYVGTIAIPVSSQEEGSCRATSIIWRASVPFVSCSSLQSSSPHTANVSFYSGYNQIWTGIEEQTVTITSAGGACFSGGIPAVTFEFLP